MPETIWRRLFRGVRRLRQHPDWEGFVEADWPDRIMGLALHDRFHAKQGRTIVRWEIEKGGRRLVVFLKRHYRLPWWNGLAASLWPDVPQSPALQEWEHLEWAHSAGLPAPVPMAVGESIGPWFRLQSFIAVEELDGMLPLHEAVPAAAERMRPAEFAAWKRGLVAEMAAVVADLHRRDRFHKDLYLCHFYVPGADAVAPPDWRGRVRLIDFHRLGRHRWTAARWRVKDLAQLLYSTDVAGITTRDRAWFWRCYRRALGWGRRPRLVGWWIRIQAWNYERRGRKTG